MNEIVKAKIFHLLHLGAVGVLIFFAGLFVGQTPFFASIIPSQYSDIRQTQLYQNVWDTIQSDYFYKHVNTDNLYYDSIKGMVDSLNDPATLFLSPSDEAKFEQATSGDTFAGIGIELGYKNDTVIVQRILPDSPAGSAGVAAGDTISAVNGKATQGQDINSIVDEIRGPAGSRVTLTVKKLQSGNTADVVIKRQPIHVAGIFVKQLTISSGAKVDDLVVSRFTEDNLQDWENEWDQSMQQIHTDNPSALVIDLRDNPGGFFDGAIYALSDFLPKGSVGAMQEDRNGTKTKYSTATDPRLGNIKVAVLVNGNTASAAEIFSGALQYYKRATIVGMPTYGKGTAQKVYTFSDGSSLHLTTDHWLLPSGRWIQKSDPIKPDVQVDYTNQDFLQGNDPQLDKALSLL